MEPSLNGFLLLKLLFLYVVIRVLISVFGFVSLVMFLCLSVSLQIFIMQKCATLGKGELKLC